MKKWWMFALLPLLLPVLIGILILGPFVIKWLWAWTVPDLFPGAALTGLVAKTLSWWSAFKLAVFVAFLAAITGIRPSKND
ncbi:MAG: hypothetical protein QME74_07885 [Candidatus Edwardsbacteria bacterium]|nr:hypothetical protein [Candidatus Edwardsbacteria bacterium]